MEEEVRPQAGPTWGQDQVVSTLNELLVTDPTQVNVNDFRGILIKSNDENRIEPAREYIDGFTYKHNPLGYRWHAGR